MRGHVRVAKRDWTTEAIDEAVQSGKQVRAVNKATGNPATRNPSEHGQSVVIDDVTGQVIHVGGPGFKYGGPGSGSPVTLAEIFVRVLDENVDVWRPVKAEQIAWDRFRIVEQPNDRGTERWDFEPGDEVMCELVDSDDETFLTTLLQP